MIEFTVHSANHYIIDVAEATVDYECNRMEGALTLKGHLHHNGVQVVE